MEAIKVVKGHLGFFFLEIGLSFLCVCVCVLKSKLFFSSI